MLTVQSPWQMGNLLPLCAPALSRKEQKFPSLSTILLSIYLSGSSKNGVTKISRHAKILQSFACMALSGALLDWSCLPAERMIHAARVGVGKYDCGNHLLSMGNEKRETFLWVLCLSRPILYHYRFPVICGGILLLISFVVVAS